MQTSGPASNAQWYLARDGEQFGPISDQEMARFVELGHLKPNDLLWREGFPDWRPAMVVFPPHGRPLPTAPRPMPRADVGRPHMMGDPFATPAPHERARYAPEEQPRRRRSVLGRVARLLAMVAVLAAAAGAAYLYRAQLMELLASLTEPSISSPPVGDRRSVELPPLAGFRADTAEAMDATLQATALWKVVKREFPDWYGARLAEAVQMVQAGKDEAVIAQLMARKLADLRRQHAGSAAAATADRLKAVAVAYLDNLKRLKSHSAEACAGFIRKGEAEPLIVALLQQGSAHTAPLQTQLTAIFEAIADGRQTPRVHIRPSAEHRDLLNAELVKRGLTKEDLSLLSGNMAEAPAAKVCQVVYDYLAAHFALSDPEAQMRLLILAVRPVFAAG